MQIKIPVRNHLTLVRMPISERQSTHVGDGVEKREPSYTVGGNITYCRHCGKQYGGSSNFKNGTII